MVHQLVVGRAQQGVAGLRAEACLVDQRLRMLDAETDRKWFCFDEHAARMQHREGVAGAVAERQHHMVGAQLFAAGQRHPAQMAHTSAIDLDQHIIDTTAEADLAAQRFDRRAHAFNHRYQPERADMRLVDVEDFLRRTGGDELGQYLAPMVQLVADLAIQFSVGKRARAAFAELHVGFWIQHVLPPQSERIHRTFAHRLAAFEDDRAKAHLRQHQPGEQAAWAHSDHQWPERQLSRRPGDKFVGCVRGNRDLAAQRVGILLQPLQDACLARRLHIHRIDQHDGRALARVVAALGDGIAGHIPGRDAKPRDDRRRERGLVVVQRQFEVGDAKHGDVRASVTSTSVRTIRRSGGTRRTSCPDGRSCGVPADTARSPTCPCATRSASGSASPSP